MKRALQRQLTRRSIECVPVRIAWMAKVLTSCKGDSVLAALSKTAGIQEDEGRALGAGESAV